MLIMYKRNKTQHFLFPALDFGNKTSLFVQNPACAPDLIDALSHWRISILTYQPINLQQSLSCTLKLQRLQNGL